MRIGVFTAVLGDRPFEAALDHVASLGAGAVEVAAGGYNVRTLLRLRDAAGPFIAANFDPSHLWWQGADPLTVVAALGDAGALAHVHAKDTELLADRIARDGVLETTPSDRPEDRAWRFRTVGLGHPEPEWAALLGALAAAGYDGTVSVEHEDRLLEPEEGLARAIGLLLRVSAGGSPAR